MSYTNEPKRFDHDLLIGDTYQPAEAQLLESTGLPYSLVGATGLCQVRREIGGEVVLTPIVTITDAAEGRFTWSAPALDTAPLIPGDAVFAVRLTFGDGTVRHVLIGRVKLLPAWAL